MANLSFNDKPSSARWEKRHGDGSGEDVEMGMAVDGESVTLEYRGGKLSIMADDLEWFVNAISDAHTMLFSKG